MPFWLWRGGWTSASDLTVAGVSYRFAIVLHCVVMALGVAMRVQSTLLVVAFLSTAATARLVYPANKPCSGKKGGISHCAGEFFVCRDGTTSQSKKDCRSFGGVPDQRQAPAPKEKGKRK